VADIIDSTVSEEEPRNLDIEQTVDVLQHRVGVRALALTGLFVLGCFYTLYFARDFFIPIVLALVFSFLLNPVVRALNRLRIPLMVGSAIVIIGGFALVAGILYELYPPVSDWLKRVPEILSKLQGELQRFRTPVNRASQEVQNITKTPEKTKPLQVELREPSPLAGLFSKTYSIGFAFLEFTILLFFLLASGDLFLRKLIHVTPRFEDKKRAVKIAREIEDSISRYLLTVASINIGLGTGGALIFAAFGMPNPILWGALGATLNFVPYLGALMTAGVTGLVAFATFPHADHAILVPLSYLALASIEGSLLTPWIVGHRMTLNRVVVFIGLTFWGFMWGILGTLLAVPLLVMFKVFCDHVEPLASIGEFLGD
jgi:predicted PurR-regulated permease PerM